MPGAVCSAGDDCAILHIACFHDVQVDVAIKVAGIHWWYKSRSHAAEMTAGYWNFLARDGYKPIASMLRKRGVGLSFTCIEMSDNENPDARHSSPERECLCPALSCHTPHVPSCLFPHISLPLTAPLSSATAYVKLYVSAFNALNSLRAFAPQMRPQHEVPCADL